MTSLPSSNQHSPQPPFSRRKYWLLSGYESEDLALSVALSLSEEELKKSISTRTKSNVDELARALQESLDTKSPPPEYKESPRICAGCENELGLGKFLNKMGALWHRECFNCYACCQPIIGDFCSYGDHPYHKSCCQNLFHPKCDVCKEFVPIENGKFVFQEVPFWMQMSCPSHEHDGTHDCFSCHRMMGYPPDKIAGLCRLNTQNDQIKFKLRKISIFILKGLPRILTGLNIVHEMMHAWLYLNEYPKLDPRVEEGICVVLSYMWLDIEMRSGSDNNDVSPCSSSSSAPCRKGPRSQFERKFGEYCKYNLENQPYPIYKDGFRLGHAAVIKYGLRSVLDHIKLTGNFPC
ncbi:Protein DA1 [Platanthera zijinensis]|uniref:Protein DA1 n=1 Tax=Platanthera zijinensis TaxID=2320716 RepID=A0AAP0BXX1_9ASPA